MKKSADSNFAQMLTVVKFEFLRHLKSKRILATFLLIVPITIVSIILIAWGGAPELIDFVEEYFTSLTLILAMLGVFFGSDAISSEFAEKTGYVTLTAPVGRGWLTMGKFIAALVVIIPIAIILYIIGAVYMFATYGVVPGGIVSSFFLALLFGCAALALSFLFSTVIPGDVLPVTTAFFVFIVIMPLIEALLVGIHAEPWYLLTFFRRVVAVVVMTPTPFRVITTQEGPIYAYPELLVGIIVVIGYIVGSILLSIYVFKRRQMS